MNGMIIGLSAVALLALAPGVSFAQSDQPSATVDFSGGSVAAGIGYSWGQGILHFQGMDYPFTINGLSIANVGASSVAASGNVYNLARVEDFPGNYTGIQAGVTVAGGVSGTAMRNQNGVVMRVASRTQGLQFTLAPKGMAVALSGSPVPASSGSSASGSSSPSRQ